MKSNLETSRPYRSFVAPNEENQPESSRFSTDDYSVLGITFCIVFFGGFFIWAMLDAAINPPKMDPNDHTTQQSAPLLKQ